MPFFAGLLTVLLDGGVWSLLSDSRKLGEATLIGIGAIAVGFFVARLWPRSLQPILFGALAATGVVAVLAYIGVASAGIVLWLFIAAAVVLFVLAVAFN